MTFLATNGVQSYARAVREALDDLPPEQAHAVLDGLDEHLAEIVAEGTVDLEAVLGPPESYAAELRASAGLPAAPRRTSWAAPVAELRADVPTAGDLSDTTPPLAAPRRLGLLAALRRRLSTRGVPLSRAFLMVFFGTLLIYLIRSARAVNIIQVVFGTLFVTGVWRLLRCAAKRAELPASWMTRAPQVLGGTAILLALILGSGVGSSGTQTQVVYVSNAPPVTVFATIPPSSPAGSIAVPNMIGETLADTRETLSRFGLTVVAEGGEPDLSNRLVVTVMDPLPGTLVLPGSVVRVAVVSISSLLPTTIATQTTVRVSPPTTPIPPTVLPESTALQGAKTTAASVAAPAPTTSTPVVTAAK